MSGTDHAAVRAAILENFAWAGLRLDAAANAATVGREGRISAPDSRIVGAAAAPNSAERKRFAATAGATGPLSDWSPAGIAAKRNTGCTPSVR